MRTVYRVQNEFGRGPYQEMKAPSMWGAPHQPSPQDDFAVFEGAYAFGFFPNEDGRAMSELIADYRFGFPTLEAAQAWWAPEDLRWMAKRGCHLMAIPADDVMVSDSGRQCIFKPAPGPAVPVFGDLLAIEEVPPAPFIVRYTLPDVDLTPPSPSGRMVA